MPRIGADTALFALLQAQAQRLAERSSEAGARRPADAQTASARTSADPAGRASPGQAASAPWSAAVANALATIAPQDPERRRKAFRAFLEASLALELRIEDPHGAEFQQLLAGVQEAMQADPKISAAIDEAGEHLIRQAAVERA
jgi:hypothetical protein